MIHETAVPGTRSLFSGTICVAVDGTAASGDALSWAERELTSRPIDRGRRMIICRSYGSGIADTCLPSSPDATWLALADPGLDRKLRNIRQRLLADDISVDVSIGSVAHRVRAHAAADGLTVVAASERAVRAVADIAGHMPGVVVAVRPTTPPAGITGGPFADHVVVGVNGASSRAAVWFAFDYAERHGKPIAAVHARATDPGGAWVDDDDPTDVHLTPYAFGLDRLEAAIADAHETWPDVPVRRFVLRERPETALVRASAGAILLVVGDRGRPTIARRFLGSVSRHAVRAAHCSVAVVHNTGGT